jgi:hypothetical protein
VLAGDALRVAVTSVPRGVAPGAQGRKRAAVSVRMGRHRGGVRTLRHRSGRRLSMTIRCCPMTSPVRNLTLRRALNCVPCRGT